MQLVCQCIVLCFLGVSLLFMLKKDMDKTTPLFSDVVISIVGQIVTFLILFKAGAFSLIFK